MQMQILAVLLAALALLLLPGSALAAPGDPWVAYVANSVVTKQSAASPVVLKANPATGALTEVSRNGAQGDFFRHPYDIAVAADGSLLVADMGAYATPSDRTPDGRIIRVDPVTGVQSLVASGNLLVDPAGLALAPNGLIYVIENVGTLGQPGVVSVDPATGAQSLVTQGGQLCYPFGIAVHPNGSVLVTDYGDFSDGTTVINCTHDFGALVKVDPVTKTQSILSRNAAQWGNLFRNPLGVTVEPGGRILIVNQNGSTGLVAVNPETGVQDAETTNSGTDRLVLPQRPSLTPDGDVIVSDFTLDDMEGGLVSVDLPDGGQSVLRQDRQLFNNPLGVAVVANREPVAALSVSPAQGRRRQAGDLRRLGFARSGGAPASILLGPRRQRQLRDGRRHHPHHHVCLQGHHHLHPARARERPARRLGRGRSAAQRRLDPPRDQQPQGPRLDDHLSPLRARTRDDPAPAEDAQALEHDQGAAAERCGWEEPPVGAERGARGKAAAPHPLPRRGDRGRRGRQSLPADTPEPLGEGRQEAAPAPAPAPPSAQLEVHAA